MAFRGGAAVLPRAQQQGDQTEPDDHLHIGAVGADLADLHRFCAGEQVICLLGGDGPVSGVLLRRTTHERPDRADHGGQCLPVCRLLHHSLHLSDLSHYMCDCRVSPTIEPVPQAKTHRLIVVPFRSNPWIQSMDPINGFHYMCDCRISPTIEPVPQAKTHRLIVDHLFVSIVPIVPIHSIPSMDPIQSNPILSMDSNKSPPFKANRSPPGGHPRNLETQAQCHHFQCVVVTAGCSWDGMRKFPSSFLIHFLDLFRRTHTHTHTWLQLSSMVGFYSAGRKHRPNVVCEWACPLSALC